MAAPAAAGAQLLSTTLGFAGGLIGGVHVTTGIFVFKSRVIGWNMHTAEDVLSIQGETLPVLIGPVAGALLGYYSPDRLGDAATWGGVGLLGGAIIGAGVGHVVWGHTEGRWSGGTVGSAAGLAIGAVLGALLSGSGEPDENREATAAPMLMFSIPIGSVR
jgi:hypothetical protein